MTRTTALVAVLLATAMPAHAQSQNDEFYGGPPNRPELEPAFPGQWRAPIAETQVEPQQEVIAEGLEFPWAIAELPDGRLLVTERAGRLRIVSLDGTISDPIEGVPEVVYEGQGGLLDVVLAPDFEQSREIFFTYSKPMGSDGENTTAVAKGSLSEDGATLENVSDIFVQQPSYAGKMHFGSRIVFEDNDTMFVALGERSDPEPRQAAQDLEAHLGKVVRINRDGSAPQDNPFVGREDALAEVFTWGNRNIQAAARNPETGNLWVVEMGPQGGDELNLIEAGNNYGWPLVTYGEEYSGAPISGGNTQREGTVQPAYYWDPVIAPSGAIFYEGELFPWTGQLLVGGLVTEGIIKLEIEGERVAAEDRLVVGIGRVREIEELQDGSLLVAIDAEDGRLVRLTPAD